jgi:hypothetical protein
VTLIGTYGTDLTLRTEINRYMVSEDPYGTLEFVEFGVERGDLRADLDVEMAASMLDWMAGGFQDALVSKDLGPWACCIVTPTPRSSGRCGIEQFVDLLRRSLGSSP